MELDRERQREEGERMRWDAQWETEREMTAGSWVRERQKKQRTYCVSVCFIAFRDIIHHETPNC